LHPGPSTGEEEVETHSEHSMASGLPLQTRAPRDTAPSSTDLAQWPVTHLVGMIRASTDQLEQRLQQAERSAKYAREEALLAQACKTQEAHAKIQVEHRLERVQERLVEAWPKFRRSHPNCPKPGMQESQSIRLSCSKEHGHNWPFTLSIWKCSCGRLNKKQRNSLRSCRSRWKR
jgi:hypothetical protein